MNLLLEQLEAIKVEARQFELDGTSNVHLNGIVKAKFNVEPADYADFERRFANVMALAEVHVSPDARHRGTIYTLLSIGYGLRVAQEK